MWWQAYKGSGRVQEIFWHFIFCIFYAGSRSILGLNTTCNSQDSGTMTSSFCAWAKNHELKQIVRKVGCCKTICPFLWHSVSFCMYTIICIRKCQVNLNFCSRTSWSRGMGPEILGLGTSGNLKHFQSWNERLRSGANEKPEKKKRSGLGFKHQQWKPVSFIGFLLGIDVYVYM